MAPAPIQRDFAPAAIVSNPHFWPHRNKQAIPASRGHKLPFWLRLVAAWAAIKDARSKRRSSSLCVDRPRNKPALSVVEPAVRVASATRNRGTPQVGALWTHDPPLL